MMKKKPGRGKTAIGQTTVHVPLSEDLKEKLDTMAAADRRKFTDFVRLLIDQEWDRRKGAKP